ncbi:MAG: hypothetical protein L3J10_04295 [Sulfurimonas sp.]|nr:hypothetical protein [Sulfurimonas sp.]
MFKILLITVLLTSSIFAKTNDEKVSESKFIYTKAVQPKITECVYGTCPDVKDGYRARIRNIDFNNGLTYCYVYEVDSNIVLDTIVQKNEMCVEKNIKIAKTFKNKLDESNKEKSADRNFLEIKELKDFYFGSYINTGDKEFLDASKYMIAGLTLDNKIININESINKNRVVLQDGYTMFPNASTNYHKDSLFDTIKAFFVDIEEGDGSEIIKDEDTRLVSQAHEMLSSITVFIMHFMGDYNESMLKIKSFLLFTILPFTALFVIQAKATKHASDIQDHDDMYERLFFTALALFIFYFSTTTIKIDNRNFDEQTKISQSNFQNWFRTIFYEGADFATEVARGGTTAYLKWKTQDIGIASDEILKNLKIEKDLLEGEQKVIYLGNGGVLSSCYKTFDTDKLKAKLGIYTTYNSTFPHIESVKINNYFVNWYSHGTFIKEGMEHSHYSANGCYNFERNYLFNKNKIEELQRDIEIYTKVNQDENILKQVEILTKTQYRNSAELGWIGFTMIPSLNIALSELQIIDTSIKDDINSERLKQIQRDSENLNNIDSGLGTATGKYISEIMGGVAYMMLPGADSLYNMFTNGGSGLIEAVSSKIPFLGSVVGKVVGGIAVPIMALVITIYIMKFLIVIFPLIAIIMAGVMAIAYYFFSMELYFLVSPFLIAFAMASQQGDIIKKFLKIGVSLALKPLMIVISLIMAIWVYEFFNVFNHILVDWNFESIFAVKDAGGLQPMNTLFLKIAQEFIHIGVMIIGFFTVFYMVLNGANMILDMLGISDANVDVQSSIGSNIDNKSGKYNTGGM